MQDYTGMFEKVAARSKYRMAVQAENAIFNGTRNRRLSEVLRNGTGSMSRKERALVDTLGRRGKQQVDAALNRVDRLYGKVPDGFTDRTFDGSTAGYNHGIELLRTGFTSKDLKPAR